MGSKKKIIIAISAFALVIVATIVSVVAVLAAQQVYINTNISIQYQVDDVFGTAFAHYKFEGETDWTAVGWKEGFDGIFNGTEDEDYTESTKDLVFTENPTNTATTQGRSFSLSSTFVIVRFGFYKEGSKTENPSEDFYAQCTLTYRTGNSSYADNLAITCGNTENALTTPVVSGSAIKFDGSKEKHVINKYNDAPQYFYIKFAIKNKKQDVDEVSFNIAWHLQNAEAADTPAAA